MENLPIPVRGHHLSRIKAFSEMGFQDYARLMIQTGYAKDFEDSFISETYNFIRSLNRDSLQILVVGGNPDFICQKCSKKSACSTYNPTSNPLFNTAFWSESLTPHGMDKTAAEEVGLKIGEVYPVKEIIRATESQTKDFLESLL